jgi:stage II sporulation protein AA (anti-sigma F factor antagonist)
MSLREPMDTELAVVRLPEEVDLANSPELLESLLSTIDRGGAHIVVDGRDVRFMDSSGLNALVRARQRAEETGGAFHLVAAQRKLRRLLELTALDGFLHRVDTVEEAATCTADGSDHHVCGAGLPQQFRPGAAPS